MNFNRVFILTALLILVRCAGCYNNMMDTVMAQGIYKMSSGVRESTIDFVLAHEGGFCVHDGVEYNYGLSGKYHGDVRNISKDSARRVYRRLWDESRAAYISDPHLAMIFFDSYVLFNPTLANEMLRGCYDPRTYLLRRLAEHEKSITVRPQLKKYLWAYVKRINDLYDLTI